MCLFENKLRNKCNILYTILLLFLWVIPFNHSLAENVYVGVASNFLKPIKLLKKNFESEKTNKHDGVEAYQTLVNWVKSVPNTIKEIEENGSKEELIRYKKQVKMVVEKLKEIEDNLPKGN